MCCRVGEGRKPRRARSHRPVIAAAAERLEEEHLIFFYYGKEHLI
jgi:hypothetical protein